METWQFVVALVETLEGANVPYMVVGSLSASVYGITRSTKDADFVLELAGRPLADVISRLGPEFKLDRQLSFETNAGAVRQRIFVGENGFLIELFRLSDDPHDQARFQRRRMALVPILGRQVYVPSGEDVILTKMRWILTAGRHKDRSDVVEVLAVQGDALDWDYIHGWCEQHATRQLLDELRREVPPI